jgi:putative redox protein
MTLRLYARHKGLALDHVGVRLRHDRRHAEDCAACARREGRIEVIHRLVTMRGDLDRAQRRRLLEIADRCPVHRTLTGQLEIHTNEAD